VSARWRNPLAFAQLLVAAVSSQALLSAASLTVGLILIRGASDREYGFYVLAANAIMLLASLQNALFSPALALRIPALDRPGRADLVGGLHRAQRRIVLGAAALTVAAVLGLWRSHVLDADVAALIATVTIAGAAILHREYFRLVLFAMRRPHVVLRADAFFAVLTVAGAALAVTTSGTAAAAVATLAVAAAAGGYVLARNLRTIEPWSATGGIRILREVAPLALWSTGGAATHWAFSQGYIYLVAGTLDVSAVAAIAATRLLVMPINLLSTGIGSQMLPVASSWLRQHGPRTLWRRLLVMAGGMSIVTLGYLLAVWLCRDWLVGVVLKRHFAQRDDMILMWGAICLAMVARDQLVYLLAAQGRFRVLTVLTLASAAVSLAASYAGMLRFGGTGALLGVLAGEIVNSAGIVVMSLRTAAAPVPAPA
jgi:O-antigen/teichoic acid export membrane protein